MTMRTKFWLAAGGLLLVPGLARSQTTPPPAEPHTYYACYQQSAGIVYRIREPGLPTECLGKHIMFSWSDNGTAGERGPAGLSCWDANGDGVPDPAEDKNSDGVWDARDCAGAAGAPGAAGRACWDLNGNGTADLPDEDKNGDGVVNALDCQGFPTGTAATGDLGGTYPGPTVAGIQGRSVSSAAPTNGQVLTYNGTSWTPGSATVSGTADGDLSGTYPNPTVARLQGTAVSPTAPTTSGQVLAYNGTSWQPWTAAGDVGGLYNNLRVTRIQGTGVNGSAPSSGQVLAFDGSNWTPTWAIGDVAGNYGNLFVQKIQGHAVSAANPMNGQALVFDGSSWVPGSANVSGAASGDLSGTYPNPTVARLQGRPVSNTAPNAGLVLTWDGASWAPGPVTTNAIAYGAVTQANLAPGAVSLSVGRHGGYYYVRPGVTLQQDLTCPDGVAVGTGYHNSSPDLKVWSSILTSGTTGQFVVTNAGTVDESIYLLLYCLRVSP